MGHVPLTSWRVHQTSMPCLLQIGARVVQLRAQIVAIVPAEVRSRIARQERIDRSRLVRTGNFQDRASVTPWPYPVPPSAAIR